ncbi:MAG TPA: hypothetical protein VFU23_10350 [Gemmatimonadales bacterium]|nr:hypothetical protein [Gemmatimonadales bacterium]
MTAQPTPPPGVAVMGFVPGSRTIWQMNLANLQAGDLPAGMKLLQGNLELGSKDGKPTLFTNKPTELLISLPEVLPADFTIEFEIAAKKCCNPEDLMFEGALGRNRGVASAEVTWHPSHIAVVGGGEMYQSDVPEDLGLTLPNALAQVNVSYANGALKLYTNGRRLYTLNDRKFARGRFLHVTLGGQDGPEYAVHLAGFRIATNSPAALFEKAASGFVAGSRTLYDLNAPPPPPTPPGQKPKPRPGIRVVQGAWTTVQKDGMRMFKAAVPTELLVSLLEPLPQDFTLELQLVPKACCNPADLAIGEVNQGAASARFEWYPDALSVNGGAPDMYQAPMPEDFKVILPAALTEVTASFEGTTVKLYTNGRRLYTLTDRRFARGRTLHLSLGGQDDGAQAVYLAKLRIATNSPPP